MLVLEAIFSSDFGVSRWFRFRPLCGLSAAALQRGLHCELDRRHVAERCASIGRYLAFYKGRNPLGDSPENRSDEPSRL